MRIDLALTLAFSRGYSFSVTHFALAKTLGVELLVQAEPRLAWNSWTRRWRTSVNAWERTCECKQQHSQSAHRFTLAASDCFTSRDDVQST